MDETEKALIVELTQAVDKLRKAIAPPGEMPGLMRVQEYYKLLARERVDVKTVKSAPYEIKHTEDPKIIILTAYGDDIQVDFNEEVTEASPWVFDKGTRWWSTKEVNKIYAKSRTTDLTTYPNGLYIEIWG